MSIGLTLGYASRIIAKSPYASRRSYASLYTYGSNGSSSYACYTLGEEGASYTSPMLDMSG